MYNNVSVSWCVSALVFTCVLQLVCQCPGVSIVYVSMCPDVSMCPGVHTISKLLSLPTSSLENP